MSGQQLLCIIHVHETPISVLKAGHVEHRLSVYIFYNLWISISLSLF